MILLVNKGEEGKEGEDMTLATLLLGEVQVMARPGRPLLWSRVWKLTRLLPTRWRES